MSSLDRNSADSVESTALASPTGTSGRSDKTPILAQHAEQGALSSTENVLPRHGVLAWNLDRSFGKEPVDEPSLSGEPECLMLCSSSGDRIEEENTHRGKEQADAEDPASEGCTS